LLSVFEVTQDPQNIKIKFRGYPAPLLDESGYTATLTFNSQQKQIKLRLEGQRNSKDIHKLLHWDEQQMRTLQLYHPVARELQKIEDTSDRFWIIANQYDFF
jgi:hypothetical protein